MLRDRVPQHIARLVMRLVTPLVVDFSASRRLVVDNSASRRLVVDYFVYATRRCASARRAVQRLSSTTSPTLRDRVPRHVVRLVTRLVASLVVDFSASRRLVVDYSASRRLVVDYFVYAARRGASARRAARHADRRAARRRLLRLRRASGCLSTSRGSSLVVDCFSYAVRPGVSARRVVHRLSSTTSPMLRDRVPRYVVRLVTRLVAPLVVDFSASRRLVVDYSASRRLVVDYFAYTARRGASARCTAHHADRRAARRRLLRLRRA
jgi:hypothetical protein